MTQQYVISERDFQRIQQMLRWFEHERKPAPPQRRGRGGGGGGSGGGNRRAKVQEAAGADNHISVKLCNSDGLESGGAFDVNCEITGGDALNAAIPKLDVGSFISIYAVGNSWFCDGFQTINTDQLEVVSGKLQTTLDPC